MNKKILTIAAAVAAVLAVGSIGATSYIGKTTEAKYNGQLDKMLAELPFLKVEKRSYERSLFGAESNLVLRVDIPEPPEAADEADEDEEGAEAGPGAQAGAGSADPATAAVASAKPVPPRAIIISVRDLIKHGPFPGALAPAASKIASTVNLAAESAGGTLSGPWQAMTADTTFDFGGSYASHFVSPAAQWKFDDARLALNWAGLDGNSTGRSDDFSSRYTSKSPGLTLTGSDKAGRPFELSLGQMNVEGQTGPSTSLLTAPGEMKMTLASMRFNAQSADGEKATLSLTDMTGSSKVAREGDLLDMRSAYQGRGMFNETPIDSFEMVEHYGRIHAPSIQKLVQNVMAGMGDKDKKDPALMQAAMLQDMRALLPFDPSYELEKLSLSIGGKQAELGYRVALKGAKPEMLDNPMSLIPVLSAGLRARLPRDWVEALTAGSMRGVAQVDQVGALIDQGVQMGFLAVDASTVSTQVSFDGGLLAVNGQTVFQMPPQR